MDKRPGVGVGVIIANKGKVLLIKRKNSHGEGTWAFVGGHLEFGETPEECAKREVLEEVGIKIKGKRILNYTNDFFKKEDKHYITLFVLVEYQGQEIVIKEPEKIEAFGWFSWKKLPNPLFLPLKNLLKSGFNPFA